MKKLLILCFLQLLAEYSSLANKLVQRRVTHGTRPPSFNYPYTSQARLFLDAKNGKTFACTGTIITDQVVLTAAHCLEDKIKIVVGYKSFILTKLKKIPSIKWYIHPTYEINNNLDLGLVVTLRSMKLTNNVQAAHPGRWIINSDSLHDHSRPSVLCGWGQIAEGVIGPGMSCVRYPVLDQECLTADDSPDINWCFYTPRSPYGENDTWSNACYG